MMAWKSAGDLSNPWEDEGDQGGLPGGSDTRGFSFLQLSALGIQV